MYEQDNIIIPAKKGQIRLIHEFLDTVGEIDQEKDYTLKIETTKRKRSLDANAYFWTLCKDLAIKLGISYMEVYRHYVRDYGAFNIMPIADKAVSRWIENWENRGDGWICESIGKSKLKGYENIKCYYGSSVYDTAEMSRLIDAIVEDCKAQGIETRPPDEIERMKQQWGV